MLCYHCKNAPVCSVFRTAYSFSDDFSINQCKHYIDSGLYKYKKIANNDDLMRLIYDYFTDQIQGDYSEKEVKDTIIHTLLNL